MNPLIARLNKLTRRGVSHAPRPSMIARQQPAERWTDRRHRVIDDDGTVRYDICGWLAHEAGYRWGNSHGVLHYVQHAYGGFLHDWDYLSLVNDAYGQDAAILLLTRMERSWR